MNKLTKKEELKIAKETISDWLYEDLDHLEKWLTIDDIVKLTNFHNEEDIKKLIMNGILSSIRKQGRTLIRKDVFINWYAEEIRDSKLEELEAKLVS